MYENKRIKENNYAKLMLGSVFIVVMFIAGFLSGGSFIYGIISPEIDDLQYQMELLQSKNNIIENQNITYTFNDTSLSNIYKEVKDSIVVISGVISYQTFSILGITRFRVPVLFISLKMKWW